MNTSERNKSRRLGELVAAQNANINFSIDRIVENATQSLEQQSQLDSDEFRKTTELLVMNSLVMGDAPPSSRSQ